MHHSLRGATLAVALAFPRLLLAQETPLQLSLHDAVTLARTQNTAAALAGIRADEIEARIGQRRADLLPSLSAFATDGERTFNTTYRVHVLHFGSRAECGLPHRSDGDVCIATQRAFFHIAGANAQVLESLAQSRQIQSRLLRRANVGFADDLD